MSISRHLPPILAALYLAGTFVFGLGPAPRQEHGLGRRVAPAGRTGLALRSDSIGEWDSDVVKTPGTAPEPPAGSGG